MEETKTNRMKQYAIAADTDEIMEEYGSFDRSERLARIINRECEKGSVFCHLIRVPDGGDIPGIILIFAKEIN